MIFIRLKYAQQIESRDKGFSRDSMQYCEKLCTRHGSH